MAYSLELKPAAVRHYLSGSGGQGSTASKFDVEPTVSAAGLLLMSTMALMA